jgi:hypothetical protein
VDPDQVRDLLNPLSFGQDALPFSADWIPSRPEQHKMLAGLNALTEEERSLGKRAWSHLFPTLEEALRFRLEVIQSDGREAVEAREFQLAEDELRYQTATSRGTPAQISRAKAKCHETKLKIALTKALYSARENWLNSCLKEIRELKPTAKGTVLIRLRVAH